MSQALLFKGLLATLVISVYVLLLPPLALYKYTILCLQLLFKNPSLIRPVRGLDVSFTVDDLWNKPRGGTSFIWILDRHLDPSQIVLRFEKILFSNSSHYDYEKLTSLTPKFWMGIPFWAKTRTFSMQNHLRVLNLDSTVDGGITKVNFNRILVEWMQSGFMKGQPLWEVMVIPSAIVDGEQRSVMGLKIHHMIGDGYSKLRLLEKIVDEYDDDEEAKRPIIVTKSKTHYLEYILKSPSTFIKLVKDFGLNDDIWTRKKSGSDVIMTRTKFPISEFKKIGVLYKDRYGESIPLLVVAVTVFAGALRRMIYNGGRLKEESSSRMGSNFIVALPLKENHPGDYKFCNFWTHGILNVDIDEPNPLNRLRKCHDNYKITVNQRKWPEVYHKIFVPLVSLMPSWIWRKITVFNMGAPIGCTNMIGPKRSVSLCGATVLEKYAYVGLLWKHSSMTCAFFSYNDQLSATIVANQEVLPKVGAEEQLSSTYLPLEMTSLMKELSTK